MFLNVRHAKRVELGHQGNFYIPHKQMWLVSLSCPMTRCVQVSSRFQNASKKPKKLTLVSITESMQVYTTVPKAQKCLVL